MSVCLFYVADVVYDKAIIPFLVHVLNQFLSGAFGSWPVAYIASTVRNEDTRDHFLVALGRRCTVIMLISMYHQTKNASKYC